MTTQNTTLILSTLLAAVENDLVSAKLVRREFDGEFKGDIGQTAFVNAPQYFKAVKGSTMTSLQTPNMKKIPITIDQRYHVPIEYSMEELALALKDPSKALYKAIARPLAVRIDTDVLGMAAQIPAFSGTAGSSISSGFSVLQANAILTQNGVTRANRVLVINEDANINIQNSLKSLLLPSDKMKKLIDDASLGYMLYNNELVLSENILKTTASTALSGSTAIVATPSNGVGGNSLIISGLAASQTMNAGECFTISGLYAINLDNKNSTNNLQQFVVLNTVASDSNGRATVNIEPAIVYDSNSSYQNCDSAPKAGNSLNFLTTSTAISMANNMIFTKEAFALATVKVPPLKNCFSETLSYNGIGITMTADSDIVHMADVVRFDIMYGFKAINPAFAIRLIGK